MDVHKTSLLAVFDVKQRLEVPLFQRQYVWSEEQQWLPLWEDIERKFTEKLDGREDAPNHFLGAMVLDQKQTPTGHVGVRLIIDGQRRLTDVCGHRRRPIPRPKPPRPSRPSQAAGRPGKSFPGSLR